MSSIPAAKEAKAMELKPEDRALIEKVSHHLAYTLDTTGGFYGTLRAEQFAALLDAARSEGDRGGAWVTLPRSAVEVIEAARNMPRQTPAPGGCSTVHDFRIEAGVVWALDRALDEFDKDSAVYGAAPPPALPDEVVRPSGRSRKPQDLAMWPPGSTQEGVEALIDSICGCKGAYNCDCVSVFNKAKIEAWTKHNADRLPTTEGA